MSKIIKETGWKEFSTVVETNDGEQYLVSSADTFDAGFETMVFEWDKTQDNDDLISRQAALDALENTKKVAK